MAYVLDVVFHVDSESAIRIAVALLVLEIHRFESMLQQIGAIHYTAYKSGPREVIIHTGYLAKHPATKGGGLG